MVGLKKIHQHADLVADMSRAQHVDLGKALADGAMSAEELRGAVLRCTHCDSPDECREWLGTHEDGADAPPEYCRNGHLFERLKKA